MHDIRMTTVGIFTTSLGNENEHVGHTFAIARFLFSRAQYDTSSAIFDGGEFWRPKSSPNQFFDDPIQQ